MSFLEKIELKYIGVGKFIQCFETFGTSYASICYGVVSGFAIYSMSIASLVQVLGLILLYRRRKVSRNRNQRYILIGLWLTESAFRIFNIFYLFALLPRWIINILETYLSVLYYSFMILLTSDRFLVFYLNMKYPIHCTSKKLLKIFFSVVVVPVILFLMLAPPTQFEQIKLLNMAIIMQYVYISVDPFYIFIVIITCTYIFFQFRRQKKLRGNMALTRKKNQDQFNLTLPILVIATFILFNVCPNFLGIFMRTSSGDEFSMESEIPRVLYTLGWISDPLIYFCTHRTRPRPNIYKENTRK